MIYCKKREMEADHIKPWHEVGENLENSVQLAGGFLDEVFNTYDYLKVIAGCHLMA